MRASELATFELFNNPLSSFYKVKENRLYRNKEFVQAQITKMVTKLKFKCRHFYLSIQTFNQFSVQCKKTFYKVSVIQTSN